MNHKDRLRGMLNLARQPRAEVPDATVTDGVATMRLYDPIDSWGESWGTSAHEFVAALDALPANVVEIHLHINSPGGEVFEAIAILNALRAHPARIVAHVDGIAASAASVIACSADELVMGRNTELMIHDAWGVCIGNAADMVSMSDMLGHFSDNIASVYAEKAGGDVTDWRAAMAAETWYSAEEAVAAGLADSVDAKTEPAKAAFDLSVFNFAGRSAAPGPAPVPAPAPPAPPAATNIAPVAKIEDAGPSRQTIDRFRLLVATTRT